MIARQADHRQATAAPRGTREPLAAVSPADHGIAADAHPLLWVQRIAGNRAAQRVAGRYRASPGDPGPAGAAAIRVGPADDRHERAADRVAQQIIRHGRAAPGLASWCAPGPDTGGVVRPEVQRAITQQSRSGGQPIPQSVRARFEHAMGGRVRPGQGAHRPACR